MNVIYLFFLFAFDVFSFSCINSFTLPIYPLPLSVFARALIQMYMRSVCNIFHASLCLRITSDIIYSFLDYSSLILISTILKSLFNLLIDFFCFIILCIFKNSLFSFFQNSSFLTLLNFLLLETY